MAHKDDLVLADLECPVCNHIFTTQEGHLKGECPSCNEFWWLDIIDEEEMGVVLPKKDKDKIKQKIKDKDKYYKYIREHKGAIYNVEWGEP